MEQFFGELIFAIVIGLLALANSAWQKAAARVQELESELAKATDKP